MYNMHIALYEYNGYVRYTCINKPCAVQFTFFVFEFRLYNHILLYIGKVYVKDMI